MAWQISSVDAARLCLNAAAGRLIVSISAIARYLCTTHVTARDELCTKTVERAVDKVGAGVCSLSPAAFWMICTFFEQCVFSCLNSKLGWLFRRRQGSDQVVHDYCG